MTELERESITLRPIVAADLETFGEWMSTPEGTGLFQWFGYTSTSMMRERFERDGFLGPEGGALAVALPGQAVGRVEWFTSAWGRPTTSSCWTIAGGVAEQYRSRGIGSQAQRLLIEYLFANTRADRIQAWTDVDNVAAQRTLLGSGFELEGRLRRAQWRSGGWHDQFLYSILRS